MEEKDHAPLISQDLSGVDSLLSHKSEFERRFQPIIDSMREPIEKIENYGPPLWRNKKDKIQDLISKSE